MTQMIAWLSSSFADSLCWSLLHSLWQGSLWSLLLAVLLAFIPRSISGLRYSASLSCLIGMSVTVLVTWSILRLPVQEVPQSTLAMNAVEAPQTVPEVSVSHTTSSTVSRYVPRDAAHDVVQADQNFSTTSLTDHDRTWQAWLGMTVERYRSVLLAIWCVGVGICLLRCVRHRSAATVWLRGEPIQDVVVTDIFMGLKKRMRIRRQVRLIASVQALGPCVLGTISPAILIPSSLVTGMTPEQWRAVLTHELAHIRRWDDLVNFGQQVIESLLFFNPAVWWISRQVRIEREACCDAWGARLAKDPISYAQVLVDIAERLTQRTAKPSPALAFADERSGALMDRVRRLVNPQASREGRFAWPAAVALVVIAIFGVVLMQKGSDLVVTSAAQFLTDQERVTELVKVAEEVRPKQDYGSEPLVITGTLTTAGGDPLPKAIKVNSRTLIDNGSTWVEHRDIEGESSNHFRVELPIGETWIIFEAPGFASALAGPFVSGGGAEVSGVSVVLKRGLPVTVQVTDDADQPVEGARVSVCPHLEHVIRNSGLFFETNSMGSAIVDHVDPEQSYEVRVNAKGFQERIVRNVKLSADRTLKLDISRAQITSGKVIGPDGQPLEGATLKIYRYRRPNFSYDASGMNMAPMATSNSQGEFFLDELTPENIYDLAVDHPDYPREVLSSVVAGRQGLVVRFHSGVSVSGVIRGTPEQFEMLIDKKTGYQLYKRKAGADGIEFITSFIDLNLSPVGGEVAFKIEKLPLGKLEFRFGDEKLSQEITESIDDLVIDIPQSRKQPSREIEFVFSHGAEIVAPEGEMQVWTRGSDPAHKIRSGFEALTLKDGRAMMTLIVPGEIRISHSRLIGFSRLNDDFESHVPEGEGKFVVEIPVEPAGAVRGTVLNADGTPASGINVSVSLAPMQQKLGDQSGRSSILNAQTNTEGEFFVSPIPFGVKCQLKAKRDKFIHIGPEFTMLPSRALPEYTLRFNESVSAGIRVLDPDGTPLQGISVRIKSEFPGAQTTWGSYEVTNRLGEVVIPEVDPRMVSSYQAIIRPTESFRNKVVNLQAGQTIDVSMEHGLFVEGTLVDNSGLPVVGHIMTAKAGKYIHQEENQYAAESVTDQQGKFRFSNLPDEEVRIQIERRSQKDFEKTYRPTTQDNIKPIIIIKTS